MRFYLKRHLDGGWEYSPVGLKEEIREGFDIVNTIPQDIRDKELGGKDYVKSVDLEAKLIELEKRLLILENK